MTIVNIVPHAGGCPRRGQGHTDEARRIADACRLHMFANSDLWSSVGKWVVFRASDGRSPDNNTLYDSKRDAVLHTDYKNCLYFKLHPGGFSECETEAMLKLWRSASMRGFLLADPDDKLGGRDIIPRIGTDKIAAQIRALNRGR